MIDIELLGAPASIVQVEEGGQVRYIGLNTMLQDLLSIDAADFLGKTPLEAWPSPVGLRVVQKYLDCLHGGEITTFTNERETSEGPRFLQFTLTPLRAPGSSDIAYVVTVFRDVTEAIRQKCKLKEANTRLELALDVVDGAFWHFDVETEKFTASKGFASIADADPSVPFSYDDWRALIDPADADSIGLETMLSGQVESAVIYFRITSLAGKTKWMKCRRKAVLDFHGDPIAICGLTVDVTSEKIREQELESKSQKDALTNLYNAGYFEAMLGELANNRERTGFSVAIIDLNDFKPINDNHGHPAGDAVLKEFARRLELSCRKGDIACRIGGDEFAVILPASSGQDARFLATRLLGQLSNPFLYQGRKIGIDASIGYAGYSDHGSIEGMIQAADAMMYENKRRKANGRALSQKVSA